MHGDANLLILFLCLLRSNLTYAEEATYTASEQGYENNKVITAVTISEGLSATFNRGTSSYTTKYYDTGSALRCYGGSHFTVSSTVGDITKIILTFGSGDGSNAITTDCGNYNSGTWTGNAANVTFTIGGSTGHRRIASITVTYGSIAQTIAISGAPSNNVYYVGDTPSADGLIVTATYDDSSTKDVTSDVVWTFTPPIIEESTTQITATAAYGGKTDDCTYDITCNSIANSTETAYTITQTFNLIDAGNGLNTEVYVKGVISEIVSFNSTYGSITYYISEDGATESQQLQCYGGLNTNGTQFTSIDDLCVGDVVVVKGILSKYNTTYQLNKDNQIISRTGRTISSIAISGTPAKTIYCIGDTPSADGFIVTATYDDSSTRDVTSNVTWTFTPVAIEEGLAQVTATASLEHLTAEITFPITIESYVLIHNLEPTEGGNNEYATESIITINNESEVTWNITGNTQTLPWRIGGKNISGVDRDIKTESPIYGTVKKIVIYIGEYNISVNGITIFVADNPEFTDATNIKIEYTEIAENKEYTFNVSPSTDAFYKIRFNVTNTNSRSNKYIQFAGVKFYGATHDYDENGLCTKTTDNGSECGAFQPGKYNNNGTTSKDDDDYYEIANAGQVYWFADMTGKGAINHGIGYIRDFPNTYKYSTIVLPFAPDAESAANYIFFTLSEVNDADGRICFQEVKEPQAGIPYIYCKAEGITDSPALTTLTPEVATEISNTKIGGWQMEGSYMKHSIDCASDINTSYYAYNAPNNQFNRITKKLNITPFRSYITATGTTAAKQIRVQISGTTGIEEVSTEQIEGFNCIYDLSGKRVSALKKGIYIINGKKTLIK